jgi:hypothetical protein
MRIPKGTTEVLKTVALLALGLGAVVFLVRTVGSKEVGASVISASPFIPLLLLLEGGRIGSEVLTVQLLVAGMGARIPWTPLIRSSLLSYSICIGSPAGRPVSEAVRATLVSPFVGASRAAAAATAMQVLTLVCNGAMAAMAAAAAACTMGWSILTGSLLLYAAVSCAAGLAIELAARWRGLSKWLMRALPRLRKPIAKFRLTAQKKAYFPIGPAALMLSGRLMQAAQFGVLGFALGLGFGLKTLLVLQGINLAGTAAGDFVPAQLGATDGAFALAASSLGASVAIGVSIAVLIHCVQLFWVAVGALVPLLLRSTPRPCG